MNIIFLTLSRISEVRSYGIYTDLMRKFRDEGHSVYIVTPHERRFGKKTELVERDGLKILGVKTLNIQKTNVVEKGIGTLLIESQYKSAIKKYLKGVKFDLVLYSTPPITFTKVIKSLKKENPEIISYLLLKDIFPQNAVDIGMFSKKSLFYKMFRKKEIELYKNSDYIGCMSPANVKYVLEHNDFINPDCVEVAPNSIEVIDDTRTVEEKVEERNYIRKKYNLPLDKPIFIYGGNLGKPQGIPFFIECLDALKSRDDVYFVIAGDGTEFDKIQNWIDCAMPQNVMLFKRLPKDDYEMLARNCDIGLIFLDHRFTIPNYPSRLLSYLVAKMPIIAATDPNTDIGSIAQENGYGYWCESYDVKDFVACVDKMLARDCKDMGNAGYKFLLKNYQIENTYNAIVNHVKEKKKDKLLIISNNVLSYTNNNGKTILSFIQGSKNTQIKQLYFSGEYPRVEENYDFFQISDKDVLKGLFNKNKRGRIAQPSLNKKEVDDFNIRNTVGRNDFTLILRDLLWYKGWKSKKLINWLDSFRPTSVLFVAGDSIFPYIICDFIVKRFSSKLTVYVTDDYVMPRKKESFLHKFRRFFIKKKFIDILSKARNIYTISSIMKKTYLETFGYDSFLAVNMTDDLKDDSLKNESDFINFIYAGSFYYGRLNILAKLGNDIKKYNESTLGKKCRLNIYSNQGLDKDLMKKITIENACEFKGALNKNDLKIQYNKSDILVFVESFEPEQIEKVKYSLSTKVPEYMSLGKPIFAIGPKNIGSIDYLEDIAFCAHSLENISVVLKSMMEDAQERENLAKKAREKFLKHHNQSELKKNFLNTIM